MVTRAIAPFTASPQQSSNQLGVKTQMTRTDSSWDSHDSQTGRLERVCVRMSVKVDVDSLLFRERDTRKEKGLLRRSRRRYGMVGREVPMDDDSVSVGRVTMVFGNNGPYTNNHDTIICKFNNNVTEGCIYPDLFRVFYFNLRYRDRIITTKVKGVPIILDDVVKVHLGVPDFNRLIAFQSFLRHPEQQINRRQLLVGGFKVEERMIHYLIVWLLCPRATNHAQCSEQDLLLLYGILNYIHIDWPALISDTMFKARKYTSYHLPYALLISRILEYQGISVEGELTQAIQEIGTKIGETTFRQMGFVARGRVIIHKDDDHQDDDNDDMDAHMADPVQAVAPTNAGHSHMPSSSSLTMEDHFANLSKQLEDMRLAQQAHIEQIYEFYNKIMKNM
ncbi:hypothetical protein LR48_Vigan05g110200 [Vigna angularis]|uniref:Uncharacterized protein n=1 Tax=Phaseolus angularis TaxID=3914 RepID=A0A0L9UL83_PHAAN|nr:hypothetical protein LR48_Vigan05g110200 [Vigna angularis]